MPMYSRTQYEQIKDALAVAEMRHLTFAETLQYVSSETGIQFKYDTLAHMKPRLKQKMTERFKELATSKEAYQYEITKALDQKADLIAKAWDLYTRTDDEHIQRACLSDINNFQNDRFKILVQLTEIVNKTNFKRTQDLIQKPVFVSEDVDVDEQPTEYDSSAVF